MCLLIASSLKMLVEIALMLGLAQALLALLLGPGRLNNPVFQLLQWLNLPLRQAVRRLQPEANERQVQRRLLLSLALFWVLAAAAKVSFYRDCVRQGLCG